MLVEVVDPASGDPLGRQAAPAASALPGGSRRAAPGSPLRSRTGGARVAVEAEERRAHKFAAPVAAFDLTFSPSKSISAAWALADEGTKAVIYQCHHAGHRVHPPLRRTARLPLPFRQERRGPGGHRRGDRGEFHPLRHPIRRSSAARPCGRLEPGPDPGRTASGAPSTAAGCSSRW